MSQPLSIVVLLSGSGSNLQAIMDQIQAKKIDARISAVISNKANAYGLERAQSANIKTAIIDHRAYDSRESFDQALTQEIDQHNPELLVLAGFMRILTPQFVNHYMGRLINIHPSLLPDYKGINTHQRALDDNRETHGASVHFVTPELDGGPVILQASVPVKASDDANQLAKRVLTQEHIIYPKVVQWFAERRLQLVNEHILFDDMLLKSPITISM